MSKALLVSDSSWVANAVRSSLSMAGWEIHELDDPYRILEVIEETRPDVCIVDLQVGTMGGMAVVREIRAGLDGQERPRLVLLLDRAADRFLAGRAGVDASVVKPFDADELRTALGEGEPVAG